MSEPNAVEETVTAPKNVKHVESSPFDLFKPKPEKKKDDAASDDKEDEKKPATIFDVFKPKTDDDNDEKKDDGKSKENFDDMSIYVFEDLAGLLEEDNTKDDTDSSKPEKPPEDNDEKDNIPIEDDNKTSKRSKRSISEKDKHGKPGADFDLLDPFHLKDKPKKPAKNDSGSSDKSESKPFNLLDPLNLKDKIDKLVDDKKDSNDDGDKKSINLLDPFNLKDKIDKHVDKSNESKEVSKKLDQNDESDSNQLKDKIDESTDDKTNSTNNNKNNKTNNLPEPKKEREKKKDDKKSDLKPSFPNDPLNLKKTIDDAAQAMKEQGVGGLITSVQKNVEGTIKDLTAGGGAQKIIEAIIVWVQDLVKAVQEKGLPVVLEQITEKIKEFLAKSIIENNKWPMKVLTQA